MEKNPQSIDPSQSDKVTWLANEIFTGFPKEVNGLKFYTLNCGCIYYQTILEDGSLASEIGIHRDAEQGPCEIFIHLETDWKDRVVDESVVYNNKFQKENNG